jgi:hypothetical protein
MHGRYDTAEGLADATTSRVLERLAGLRVERRSTWSDEFDVAVFNPSPHPRTDVVRIPIDGFPPLRTAGDVHALHPVLLAGLIRTGFTIDGVPARVVAPRDPTRFQVITEHAPLDLEVVVENVPAFGWRRVAMAPSDTPAPDDVDDGRDITAGRVSVSVADDGTMRVLLGTQQWTGLAAVEDCGDRGDSYDADPIGPMVTEPDSVSVERRRHPSGIQTLRVERTFLLPRGLAPGREARSDTTAPCTLTTEVAISPGVERVDLWVTLDNQVDDHRFRLRFPTGAPVAEFRAATTFDVAARSTTAPDDTQWVHPAPTTFPHQGWVAANGLLIGAPGLPEAEVTADGTVAVTLLRSVGWLSRGDLRTRPVQAGPAMPAPGAQCHGALSARLVIAREVDRSIARDAELGFRAVPVGDTPLLEPDVSLLTLAPLELELSAVKPANDDDGVIVRVLNPTDGLLEARLRVAWQPSSATAVRLDETPTDDDVRMSDSTVAFDVPAHALRAVHLR